MARYGVSVSDAWTVLEAAREGVRVGDVYDEQRRFDLRVLNLPTEPTASAIGDLFVETARGRTVPLREVVRLSEGDGPVAVRRQDCERTARIDVNLRGRDLVSWVAEARAAVAADVPLPTGYTLTWGGQFENFARAQKRLMIVVPVAVGIILAMLLWMFRNLRFAISVFPTVPFALTGGMIGLMLRGQSFSLPAAVGFIALGGIAVLNGVVIASEVRALLEEGASLDDAITSGTTTSTRAVLTTAAVAALGFLPMAVATSAGAEVQRPLATVVIVGIVFGTFVTLVAARHPPRRPHRLRPRGPPSPSPPPPRPEPPAEPRLPERAVPSPLSQREKRERGRGVRACPAP